MNKIADNRKTEIVIGNVLRTGVIVAVVVTLFGGLIYLSHYGFMSVNYKVFERLPYELSSVKEILKNAFSFNGQGLIQLGLLVLLATPIARVLFSVFAFARERDRLYVVITLIVFGILIYSLLGR